MSPNATMLTELRITDLGVIDVTPEGLTLVELAPDVTEDEIREKTEPDLV